MVNNYWKQIYLKILSGTSFTHCELMVDFVDVFVDPAVMQQAVQKVVPGIFNNSTAKALSQDIRPERGDKNHINLSQSKYLTEQ